MKNLQNSPHMVFYKISVKSFFPMQSLISRKKSTFESEFLLFPHCVSKIVQSKWERGMIKRCVETRKPYPGYPKVHTLTLYVFDSKNVFKLKLQLPNCYLFTYDTKCKIGYLNLLLFGHNNDQSWQHWLCQSYHRLRGLKKRGEKWKFISDIRNKEKERNWPIFY